MSLLIVSPHLDDAVFSLAPLIVEEARQREVVVATVFSHGHGGMFARGLAECGLPPDDIALRRTEDLRAIAILNEGVVGGRGQIRCEHLGFADAPFRGHFELSYASLCNPTQPLDSELVDAIATELSSTVEAHSVDEMWFPLGVGDHIDHRSAHAAAELVRRRHPRTLLHFFEELPYGLIDGFVRLRLTETACRVLADLPKPSAEHTIAAFLRSPFIKAVVPQDERGSVVQHLRTRLKASPGESRTSLTQVSRHPTRTDVDLGIRAILAYASQSETYLGATPGHPDHAPLPHDLCDRFTKLRLWKWGLCDPPKDP